jgi:hypothetical protein
MTSQDTQRLINTVNKQLMDIASSLDDVSLSEKTIIDKPNLIQKVNNIKNTFLKNTEDIRSSENTQYLGLQTALKNVDVIFEELLNEIEKS